MIRGFYLFTLFLVLAISGQIGFAQDVVPPKRELLRKKASELIKAWEDQKIEAKALPNQPDEDVTPKKVNWHDDYATARAASQKQNRLLVIVVGTPRCSHCQRMESGTFQQSEIVGMLNDRCVSLKLDGDQHDKLVDSLGIQCFPTVIMAAPDGTILSTTIGHTDPAKFKEVLTRTASRLAADR